MKKNYEDYLSIVEECYEETKNIEIEYTSRALDKLGIEREEYEIEMQKIPP